MSWNIYKATVMSQASLKDPRVIVKIMTSMDDIDDISVLPRFPAFFADQFLNYPVGSAVWCLSNDDFDLGYVLGLTNVFSEAITDYTSYSRLESSFDSLIGKAVDGVDIGIPKFRNLVFSHVDQNLIEAFDTETGSKIIYHSTGSCFVIGPYGISMAYGKGLISLTKNKSSGKEQIVLSADSIRLNGKVSLGTGDKQSYVLGTSSKGTSISLNDGSVVFSSDMVVF